MTIPLGRRLRLRRQLLRAIYALPTALRRPFQGAAPVNDRGTPLDADLFTLITLDRLGGPGTFDPDVRRARSRMRLSMAMIEVDPIPTSVTAGTLAGRPARTYATASPHTMLYMHGGGWVVGDLDTHDRVCRRLSRDLDLTVVSLDYRLAPEHPFPAALHDAQAALTALRPTVPGRLLVGGDSAGANLALAASLAQRDAAGPLPDGILAIYPATDLRRIAPSHRLFSHGFLLEDAAIDAYRAHYGAEHTDPLASVLLAPSLAGLPPTVISTAGFDPLRDEGEQLVTALRRAGVSVAHHDAAHLCHGWANLDALVPAADAAFGELVQSVKFTLLG